jgi:ribosomal protein S18 acetylase RimI-like enzyme
VPRREDAWLSDVLGVPAFAVDPAGNLDRPAGRAFEYAKVLAQDVAAVARLCTHGFVPVDVNVTLVRPARFGAPAGRGAGVRPAEPADADRLLEIADTSFRYSRFHLDPEIPQELAGRVKREWTRSYLDGRRGLELLVAVSDGGPVGLLAVLADGDVRVIDIVAVASDRQRRGIGRALVDAFVERHGQRELRVGTQAANASSLRLYEGAGFRFASAAYVLHRHTRP